MEHRDQRDLSAPVRGRLDDQLELGGPLLDRIQPVLRVVKRDGHAEGFDTQKVARSISRAASDGALSDPDTARSLANGVALYLARNVSAEALSSDDVHGAAERLLIEMGHSGVAAAFARHRNRKRRLADLARGDVHLRDTEPASATGGTIGIGVLNSDDTQSEWSRDRIVKALHQETELDRDTANRVAEVVEVELGKLNLRMVTSGLIRELVGAVLLSLGETDQGARHRRVGIPMYDAERTILGAEAAEVNRRSTPDSTNEALAARLKREFALARVFSTDVAEAHRWGDVHLHDLGAVDRVLSMVVTPDWVKLHGVPGGSPSRPAPTRPRRADTLVAQMAGASAALRHFATESLRWDALNWSLAPFVAEFNAQELTDIARVLLFEFAYRRMIDPGIPQLAIDLMWSMPPHLQGATPLGPRNEETESSYEAYAATARRFALAILDVHRETLGGHNALQLPDLHVTFGPDCFLDRGFGPFLMRVSEAAGTSPLTAWFQRDALLIGVDADLAVPREVVAHRVTLNLPRAAYRSRNADEFLRECGRIFSLAAAAHAQKRAFLMRLLRAGDDGPLGPIARKVSGAQWFSPERAIYEIGICGLDEAAARFDGEDGLEGAVVHLLRTARAQWNADEAMELRIVPTRSVHARERLAEADLRYYYLQASQSLRPAIERGRVRYSDPAAAESWEYAMGRRPLEGPSRYGTLNAPAAVPAMIKEASPETIAHTIRDAFVQSAAPGLAF